LYDSAVENDLDGVKRAIVEGANKDWVLDNGTALLHFCSYGNITAIQWLLEEKADVNMIDGVGRDSCLMSLYHDSNYYLPF